MMMMVRRREVYPGCGDDDARGVVTARLAAAGAAVGAAGQGVRGRHGYRKNISISDVFGDERRGGILLSLKNA